MTSADFRHEPTEVLDLYDVLPEAGHAPARTEDDPVTTMIKGVGRNLAAIIGMCQKLCELWLAQFLTSRLG